jgi:hypothetical protein
MKNILAENMIRFGTKNVTESERKNLQRLLEQNEDFWDPLTKNGTDSATHNKSFATVPFIVPKTNTQLVKRDGNIPIFIGANLTVSYNPFDKPNAQSRFKGDIEFFISRKEGQNWSDTFRGGTYDKFDNHVFANVLIQKVADKNNFSFKIFSEKGSEKLIGFNLPNFGGGQFNTLVMSPMQANPAGWLPAALYNSINSELQLVGLPQIPPKFESYS